MSKHSDAVYVRHMLDHALKAIALTSGRDRDDLTTDDMLRYALLHLIALLGESANRVSPVSRARFNEIPWRKIIDMRHRLIHGYDAVDLDILWLTVDADLPALVPLVEGILDDIGD